MVEREHVWLSTPGVLAGELACRPEAPGFGELGPVQNFIVAFPRRTVRFQPTRGPAFIVHPGVALFMNRGQVLGRRAIAAEGSDCFWCGLDAETALDVMQSAGVVHGAPERPFVKDVVVLPPTLVLRAGQLLHAVRAKAAVPEAGVDLMLSLLVDVAKLDGSCRERPGDAGPFADVAHAVLDRVLRNPGDPHSLQTVAGQLGVSRAYMCAAYRRTFGRSIHADLVSVRLRTAADRLVDGEGDLTRLALDLGFASHSHFTAAFRRHFHVTPSRFRAAVVTNGRPRTRRATASLAPSDW